jgi:chromosome segregation ATPase
MWRTMSHDVPGVDMAGTQEAELVARASDVLALRAALEAAQQEADVAMQRANAEHKDEVDQLQGAITSLREEMIRQREELLAAVQAAERDGAAEAAQLRSAVVAARGHADDLQRQHDSALARQIQAFETERRELQATIAELRRRLEITTDGGHG